MKPEEKSKDQLNSELEEALRKASRVHVLEDQCQIDQIKINEQNEFLNLVLDSLPFPFYVLDANDYSIKIANRHAHLGDLSLNPTCYGLTHRRDTPCDGVEHTCPLLEVKKTKKPVTVEHIHYNQEGHPWPAEVHAFPIFDQEGNVEQLIEYSYDITERKKIEKEIRNYTEKIKLFAYSVSHDLKNPIIGLSGLTSLLCRHYLKVLNDDKGKSLCEDITRASNQVLNLLEEINIYIKSKESPVQFELFNLREILAQIRSEFSMRMDDRWVKWIEPDNFPEIKANKTAILRAFRNLVDNALNYGGEELSEIRIGHEEDKDFHTFFVSDNGVGINHEHVEKIFEPFQRSDSSKGVEGTGLGLSIVSGIAEKHGGKAWAERGPVNGATIYFSLSKNI